MSLGIGEEQTVQTTIGKHRIDFNVMGGNGGDEIELTEKSPNKKVIFKLGMGMITAKPKIISVLDI